MATLYNRTIELSVLDQEENKVYSFKGYRIAVSAVKSFEGFPNTGNLKVFNVSEKNRKPLQKNGNLVIVKAGYQGNNFEVLSGSVLKAPTVRQGTEILTTVDIGDGAYALIDAQVSQIYPAGTQDIVILKDAIKSLQDQGISVGDYDETLVDKRITREYMVSGTAQEIISKYATKYGLTWSIQDSQLEFLKVGGTVNVNSAVLLTPSTGLIGSPQVEFTNISFNTLLIPKLKIGTLVSIETPIVKTLATIKRMEIELDNYGSAWGYSCQADIVAI